MSNSILTYFLNRVVFEEALPGNNLSPILEPAEFILAFCSSKVCRNVNISIILSLCLNLLDPVEDSKT